MEFFSKVGQAGSLIRWAGDWAELARQLGVSTTGNVVSGNVSQNNGLGIVIAGGSTGNIISDNTATGNSSVDFAHDPGSSPNTWVGNTCGAKSGSDILGPPVNSC